MRFSFIKNNPIFAGIVALVLIVGLVLLVGRCEREEAGEEANLVNQGALIERDAAKTEVINHVEQAKDAVEHPTANELQRVCDKYDRNCKDGQ